VTWVDDALRVLGLGWLGSLLGIGGLVVGFLFYIWSRKRTRMDYVHLGEHLLGSTTDSLPPEIVVQYNGTSIPRLTKTVLVVWNSGENTVVGQDIVSRDPLRFRVGKDGKILSISIQKTSRAVNDFNIRQAFDDPLNEAQFGFDFLDPKDGAVIEILHTSTNRKPSIVGTMRGLPQGFRNSGQFTSPKPRGKKKAGPLSALVRVVLSPAFFLLAGFLYAIYTSGPEPLTDNRAFNTTMGGMFGFAAMWALNYFTTRRRYPKSLNLETLE